MQFEEALELVLAEASASVAMSADSCCYTHEHEDGYCPLGSETRKAILVVEEWAKQRAARLQRHMQGRHVTSFVNATASPPVGIPRRTA